MKVIVHGPDTVRAVCRFVEVVQDERMRMHGPDTNRCDVRRVWFSP